MSDLDELFRAYGARVQDPSPARSGEVARRIVAESPSGRRLGPARTWFPRLVGVIGVAALAGVLGIVFLRIDRDPSGSPATQPPAGWGLEMTVRVAPTDGQSVSDLTDRAVSVFSARAAARLMQGVEVTKVADDEIKILAPTAQPGGLEDLVIPADLNVIDLSTSIAVDDDPTKLVGAITAAGAGRPAPRYIAMTRTGQTWVVSAPQGSRAAAERFTTAPAPGSISTVVAVSDDLVVARVAKDRKNTLERPTTFVAYRPSEAVVRAREILNTHPVVDTEGLDRLALDLVSDAETRFREALARARQRSNRGETPAFALIETRPDYVWSLGSILHSELDLVPDAWFRDIELDTPDQVPSVSLAHTFVGGGLPVNVAIVAMNRYGRPPPLAGTPLTLTDDQRRRIAQYFPAPNTPGEVQQVARFTIGGKEVNVFSLRVTDTEVFRDYAWVADSLRIPADRAVGAPCGPDPGDPIVVICSGPGLPSLEGAKGILAFGRVNGNVSEVAGLRADGTRVDGAIDGGWFVIPDSSGRGALTSIVADRTGEKSISVPYPRILPRVQPGG